MTFDEAIKKVNQSNSAECIIIPKYLLVEYIEQLREEYAPTVEMTEMQMKQMILFKEFNAGFSTFMYKQGLGQLSAFSDFITTQRENELMQAWVHPETIKIKE